MFLRAIGGCSVSKLRVFSKRYHDSPSSSVVAVALSGGVDSGVSAYLLQKQGYKVFGVHMANWSEDEERGASCSSRQDLVEVRKLADHLHLDFKILNFEKEYWNDVFTGVLQDYQMGRTPNPDVACNKEIKFKYLLEAAKKLGANYLATGHYARLRKNPQGKMELLKAVDPKKDQTYFLTQVSSEAFQNVIFPVGHLQKTEVRQIALEAGLPNAQRKVGFCGSMFCGKEKIQ
eukprot:TRINITY_DN9492_c0_g1_i1.p1 TRINITY_DN9492_c0_g1~~TRINITY_DN9492_c0_g1_i1.p1  ORF type:complete len:232 (+),score=53.31 TRINITY_DN9492_c0_g1_i1:87-782(+)